MCRAVSITAVGKTTCCVISRTDFKEVLGPLAQIMQFSQYTSKA